MQFAYAHGGVVATLFHVSGRMQGDTFSCILRAGPVLRGVGFANVDEIERDIVFVFRIETIERVGCSAEIRTGITSKYQQYRPCMPQISKGGSFFRTHFLYGEIWRLISGLWPATRGSFRLQARQQNFLMLNLCWQMQCCINFREALMNSIRIRA